jgi:hypothetical protein
MGPGRGHKIDWFGKHDNYFCIVIELHLTYHKPVPSLQTTRNMGKFYRQLRHRGVISMWGLDYYYDRTNLVDILYKGLIRCSFKEFVWYSDDEKACHIYMLLEGIRNRIRKLNEVEFKRHSWVDVPDPFNLKVFAQRLFLNFHSDNNIQASKITKGGMMGEAGLIKWCREFLFERNSLVVFSGLQSTDDWELIKSTFLSSEAPTNAGCIVLVITNEETVATHCVKDHKYQAFEVNDLKADTSIATVISKVITVVFPTMPEKHISAASRQLLVTWKKHVTYIASVM